MAVDLGPIAATLDVDTLQFDRKIDQAASKLDDFAKTGEKVSKTKLDVAPTGARELDQASRSAGNLSKGLDGAAKSAGRVKAPNIGGQLDSSSKYAANLATELDRAGTEAEQLGSSGQGIGGFESSLSGLAGKAKELVPALSAAAAAGAVLTKGWSRLTSIDDAQFKLQGLGHTAESTASIMNSAMESVSGTAYGFGDAASLAAGAVAATGAQGEELTQILTTIADTAAISGRSLGDIGLIFNQVAASGSLMGDDLNQLLDSGIPVITFLAEELGVAQSEVKDLASEGAISFEILESAMRNNLGGAAQEMGGSVTGALSNVGAAAGRLGAEIMNSGFNTLPDLLEGATAAIDSLTEGVEGAYEAWERIPGPIKNVVGLLAAAKIGSMALNTEIGGKMTGGLKTMGTGFLDASRNVLEFGGATRDAARYAQQANPHLSTMGSYAVGIRGAMGGLSGAMGGVSKAAGGLLSALGGPWGLAIGGATAAIGLFLNHVQETKREQEETAAATKEWADVLTEADGQITKSVQQQALLAVENANVAESMEKVGVSSADAAAAVLDLDGSYESMLGMLNEIIKADTDTESWWAQMQTGGMIMGENATAAQEFKEELIALHNQYEQGQEDAKNAESASSDLAKQIADSSREAEGAVNAHDILNGVLEQMGIDAKDADDAIGNLANAMMGLSEDPAIRLQGYLGESAAAIQEFRESVAEEGLGGFDVETGLFDEWTEQGRNLTGIMNEVREGMFNVAAAQYQTSLEMGESGVDAAEAAAAAAREHSDALRAQAAQAGMTEEQINILFERYDLFPDDIMTQIHVAGSETATAVLDDLDTRMARVNQEDYTITVDSSALNMTAEEAKELGYTMEEDLDAGVIKLTADTDLARSAIEEIAQQTEALGTRDNNIVFRADTIAFTEAINELEGETARLATDPTELMVVADTEAARAAVEELELDTEEVDGYLYIDSNKPEVMDDLVELGATTAALPEGTVVLDSNSEYMIDLLDEIGIKTIALPNGEVMVAHDSIHLAIEAMEEAGALVRDGASGDLRVDNNFLANENAMRELQGLVAQGARGDAIMSHNADGVRDAIVRALMGLETRGTHYVDQVAVIQKNQQLAGSLGMAHFPGVGGPAGATGGRFTGARFDHLPAYAEGARHDGYRIAGSGPGTETTDGFLALDRLGLPVARLDADEWVINGDSSETFDPVLAALNANQPTVALAALMNLMGDLPGHAEGRAPSGTPTPQDMPNVEMSADAEVTLTAEGVADELSIIGQQLEEVGQGETITVDAVGDQALSVLDAVGVEATTLPDGSVEVTAAGDQALDTLSAVSGMMFEVGATVVNPIALLDSTELEVSVDQAQIILDALGMENPTPLASLIIDDLVAGKGIAQGELEFLASMIPTPAADLNTQLLEAGVSVSESELQRVGNSKATSVVDVNNTSALANVNATLDALNRMPVERTIKIVASGSAASSINRYERGGQVPALASGGRLPTTGPGTDTTDGILGVGSDGVPTALVDAGEWVITRRRSQAFHNTLDAINSGTRDDIVNALRSDMGLQALAGGGAVVSGEQLLDFAAGQNVMGQQASRSLQGAPYVWGGVNWGDCSGAMAGLANFAVGLNAFGSRFATMNQRQATAALGFLPGLGDPATSFNLGWFNGGPWGGHTSGDVLGTAVEMGGGAGGQGKIGGAAASASSGQYTDHAHLPLGELWAFDLFRSLPKITDRYQPAPNPDYVTEGGDGVSPGGMGLQIANALGGGVSHTGGDGVHLNDGTVIPYESGRLYDTGGLWPKGTWGFNDIGDEMVLPPRETEQFQALPDAAAAMYATADAVGSLHPELRRMVDQTTPQLEKALALLDEGIGQLELMADPDTVEGITARATAGRVLDMDVLPYSGELQSMLDAETMLWDARAGQAERARAIMESEQALADAYRELEELRSTDPGVTVQDQRKIADAEQALNEARAEGDAEKVADAEQKLARTREDIAANADEAAIQREEDIAKATQGVTDAENDLVTARREQAEALDHIILPDTLGGLVPQIGQAAGMLGGALPEVAAGLTGLAATALPAGVSLGMALSAVQAALSVAREIYGIIDGLVSAVLDARTAVAEGIADSMSAIREWTVLVDEQRQTVSRLRQAVVQAQIDMVAAQWDVRTAQLDLGRAQLEGVRSVAEAEAALAAERERQARANWWNTNDLSLAYDRLRWASHDAAYGTLEDYQEVTPEILALQQEVLAAQLNGVGAVTTAQLASLEAARGLAEAQKSLSRGQRDLNIAMAEYDRMSGTSFGLTVPQATVAEEIARLQAENARLAGERDSLGTRVSDAFWNFFDWSGDNKFFGLIDVPGAQQRNTYDEAIAANEESIQRLLESEYAPEWDEEQRREADRAMERAAGYYALGKDDLAEAAIQGSIWGDAQRALDENRVLDEIAQWEQDQRDMEDDIQDLRDTLNFEELAQPLREQIVALEAGAASAQYSADALREQNPMIREILEKMAAFEGDAARDIAAGRPVQQVTIIGNNFDADQVQQLLDQIAGKNRDIELRVDKLEQPDRLTGRDVMALRR